MRTPFEKIKVLIVDDHQVVRQGLRTFLDLHDDILVVGETGDGLTAVELAAQLLPDIVLMDLVMPRLDGITATSRIKSLGTGIKVIALTSFAEDERVFPAIQAGASSYLLKDVSPEMLVEAIRAVHQGEVRLHPQVLLKLMKQVAGLPTKEHTHTDPQLTQREGQVIRLVARGQSNREIARTLVISEKTAKAHISNILGKLGLDDRTQMAIYAMKHGLVDQEET